jgi:hypothetical protein
VNTSTTRRSVLKAAIYLSLPSVFVATKGSAAVANTIDEKCRVYMDAWTRKNLEGIGALYHPEVHFKGPMQELHGKDAVLAATQRIFPLLDSVAVRYQFVEGNRAMFVYDFVCREPIGLCRTAELVQFDDGLIRETELFFDARPFEAYQRSHSAPAAAPT